VQQAGADGQAARARQVVHDAGLHWRGDGPVGQDAVEFSAPPQAVHFRDQLVRRQAQPGQEFERG